MYLFLKNANGIMPKVNLLSGYRVDFETFCCTFLFFPIFQKRLPYKGVVYHLQPK